MEKEKFTRFEKARMLGSRALQIAQGAPILIKLTDKQLEEIRYNPLEIAKLEFAQERLREIHGCRRAADLFEHRVLGQSNLCVAN